jgi:hypothetical protein
MFFNAVHYSPARVLQFNQLLYSKQLTQVLFTAQHIAARTSQCQMLLPHLPPKTTS